MSNKSPFSLVRPSPAKLASSEPPRPKVVLPTRRKNIPQATEPVLLAPRKQDEIVQDVIARVKKAAVAPPLEVAPRPARDERKDLAPPTVAEPTPQAVRPGATVLPPPRKTKISVPEETTDFDPFETNAEAVAAEPIADFGKIITEPPPSVAAEEAPLTPAKIRRTKAAAAVLKDVKDEVPAPLPLTPRHISATRDFVAEGARPVVATPEAPVQKPSIFKKISKVSLPAPKVQNMIQADVQGWLEADGFAVKNHTPHSDAPIVASAMKNEAEPLVSNRRIKFCCPSCNHTISMPKRIVGQKTRCPQCASAIRAPHPKYGRGTYNYENHVEALLHPDRFALPESTLPRFMGIPIPEIHTAIIGSAAAMLVGGGAYLMGFREAPLAAVVAEHNAAQAMATDPTEPDLKKEDPFAIKEEAKQIVKSYLEANGLAEKIAFVREPERVTPLMKDYFARGHSDEPVSVTKLSCSTPGYYQSFDLKQRRSTVIAELSNGKTSTFYVEYLQGGPKIEWESSVAYSPVDWKDLLKGKPDQAVEPQLLRVAACVDKYWNDPKFQEKTHLCVYLQDPVTGDPLGLGYIPRKSEDGARLKAFLGASNKNKLDQVMIKVRPVANSAKERIVEITQFVKGGFRHPEPSTLASNQ